MNKKEATPDKDWWWWGVGLGGGESRIHQLRDKRQKDSQSDLQGQKNRHTAARAHRQDRAAIELGWVLGPLGGGSFWKG